MRLLFSCLPAYGHAYPMVPLALAARDAGHEVLFATGDPFRDNLAAFGLGTIPAGITIREAFGTANGGAFDHRTATPERQVWVHARAFGEILPQAFFESLVPVLEQNRPDLVVHEVTNVGAYFAARHTGTPGVCHGLGRVFSGGREALNRRIAAFAEAVKVTYPGGFNQGSGDLYLDICPPSLQDATFLATADRIPLRPAPVPQPGQLPGWIHDRGSSRPLIYLTLGTAFATPALLRLAVAGLARLDCDVLVSTGPSTQPDALGPVPGNVTVEPWVPQARLLPHVRLVVHHGGSGTTLGSLAAGRLLADPRYTARAGEMAAEIAAMSSPAATVPVLAALSSTDR